MRAWFVPLLLSIPLLTAGCGGDDDSPAEAVIPGSIDLAIESASAASSLGASRPAAGNRFLVFDVRLTSRGGASDVEAETNRFALLSNGQPIGNAAPTASLPAAERCDASKEVPTDGQLECTVVFEAPRALTAGELRFDPERFEERRVAWQVP
jgi:hypothetical protein